MTISRLAVFVGKTLENLDISTIGNVLQPYDVEVQNELSFNGGANALDSTKLDTLLGGADASTLHHHDGRYYTETELTARSASSGATLLGVERKLYANISGYDSLGTDDLATYNIQALLDAINTSLATAGNDEQVKITASDTTTGYLDSKLTVAAPITKTTNNPGGNENIELGLDQSAIDHGALAGLGDDDHTQYTLADGTRAFTGDQSMGSNKLTNLAAGTAATDAVNKSQLDAAIAGLTPKSAVRVRTTAALPASTYDNGTGGVGATLTADANGAFPAVDGVTIVDTDANTRILVMDQASGIQNGIYELTQTGSAGTPWILTRAADMDGSPASETKLGAFVNILEGTLHERTSYMVTGTDSNSDGDIDVGTESMDWEVFRAGNITASGFMDIDASDNITLKNLNDGHVIIGNSSNEATSVDTAAAGDIDADTVAGLTIKTDAVTTAKILNGAVTADKLATDSVTTAKILDANVTADKLATDSVTTAKIAADAVDKTKLAADVAGPGVTQEADGSLSARGTSVKFTNNSGVTIPAGSIVQVDVNGDIEAAQADSKANSQGIIGVAVASIADAAEGEVQIDGEATVVVAGGGNLTPGQEVWLSKATAGNVTQSNVTTEESVTGNTIAPVGVATGTASILINIGRVVELT